MKKKLLSGLLAGIMLLSLAGCGGSGGDGVNEPDAQSLALRAGTSGAAGTGFADIPAGADYAAAGLPAAR